MSRISVIVPVYNKAPYLRECLNSLTGQTLEDIELICIDDGSSDGSLDILREYAARDSRIRVLPLPVNGGVSAARNLGIREARGEFVAFADADDLVDPDFYEKLYAASAGYDCVKGEVWDYDPEINRCALNGICDVNDALKATGNPFWFHHGFTSAIYRRDFLLRSGARFPEDLSYNEDPFFSVTLAARLSAVRVVDGARYYYRTVSNSLSRNVTEEKLEDFCRSMAGVFGELKRCGVSYDNRYIAANQFLQMTNDFLMNDQLSSEKLHWIEQEYISFLRREDRESGEIRVSVVMPVYNGEKYLRRSLNALLLQSLYEIEIICVNDCSPDGSLELLREYERLDPRLRVIDCPVNGGESRARNIGLRAARGEYVAFMDQDDRLDLFFYEKLYEKARETGADIVKGDAVEIQYDGTSYVEPQQTCERQPLYFTGEWWTAIYRRSLLTENHVELPEGYPLGGDLKFLFDACVCCKNLSEVHGVNYYHIMHPDSGDSEETPLPKIRSVIAIFSYLLDRAEEIGLLDSDRDCYIYYYNSYIYHAYMRIGRCPETEGKLLCTDFIFERFERCRCRAEVLDRLRITAPLLAESLEKGQKHFFRQIIASDAMSMAYYERDGGDKDLLSVPCTVAVPYIDRELTERYIVQNPFLREETALTLSLIDNTPENKPISRVYNEFLDSYDYSEASWLILMHSDFEFLSFPSETLRELDPNVIYGPAGAKAYSDGRKVCYVGKGGVLEKTPDNSLYQNFPYRYHDPDVDTLDCLCLIVHSSLVERYHLRFDENTLFDLYVEDFCLQARREHQIPVEVSYFTCVHHSGYTKVKNISPRYIRQLEYINRKYPDGLYAGTVTPIGGKRLPTMTPREFLMYRIRQEILTGKKI